MSQLHLSVFGSCRVYVPLQSLHQRGLIRLNAHHPAYCHQTGDCLQQLRICEGQITVPEAVSPLVFNRAVPEAEQARHLNPVPPHATDAAVIEICTIRIFIFNGIYTQDNHCLHNIRNHFSNPEDAHLWWQEINNAVRNQPLIDRLLPKHMPPALFEAARALRAHIQTPEETIAGMKQIAAVLNLPILWVSHNRLRKENGERIPQRDAVAAAVQAGAAALGHGFVDPTPYIESYGQQRAMKENGRSLNEYTKEFIPVYGDILLEKIKMQLGRV